jgi:hypothetical protein
VCRFQASVEGSGGRCGRYLSANISGNPIIFVGVDSSSQFLNVTNVSCAVSVNTAQIIASTILFAGTTSGANDLQRNYNIRGSAIPETNTSGKFYSIVQNGIFFKIGARRFPSIFIDAPPSSGSASVGANCVIVGNLTDN